MTAPGTDAGFEARLLPEDPRCLVLLYLDDFFLTSRSVLANALRAPGAFNTAGDWCCRLLLLAAFLLSRLSEVEATCLAPGELPRSDFDPSIFANVTFSFDILEPGVL